VNENNKDWQAVLRWAQKAKARRTPEQLAADAHVNAQYVRHVSGKDEAFQRFMRRAGA